MGKAASMRVARFGIAMALAAGLPVLAWGDPVSGPVPDPGTTMRQIARQPFRYGGALQGSVPGLPDAVDQPPIHLSIGLGSPAADGTLRGEAILFDADRHLVASGPVSGRLEAGPSDGTRGCMLHLALPRQTVSMSGICTADTLSGEIVTHRASVGLLTRLVTWWGDRDIAGRYWLTPASFDPGR